MGVCLSINWGAVMSLRSNGEKFRALIISKEGVAHWWAQRLTAIFLVPLLIWLVANIVYLFGADIEIVRMWIASPVNAVLLILFNLALFHHAQLGLQVVIEDYIHTSWLKGSSIVLVKSLAVILGLLTLGSILKIAILG